MFYVGGVASVGLFRFPINGVRALMVFLGRFYRFYNY